MPAVRFLPDEEVVEAAEGETLLEAALRAGIPATHACGGNARCSTCRVLVVADRDALTPVEQAERRLLAPLGLDRPIRLACQARATSDVTVRRLVLDPEDEALLDQRREGALVAKVGEERRVAILFADLRHFTAFSERVLPYDVVHVLNRFFAFAAAVVEAHRGRIVTYLGDGFMALFGIPPRRGVMPDMGAILSGLAVHLEAPLDAVRAGLALIEEVDAFQAYLQRLHGAGFGISVGIHAGDVVVGEMGAGESRAVTAIGDAVNTASRVEWANRIHDTRILVSHEVHASVERHFEMRRHPPIELPGKSGTHSLWEVSGAGR